MSHSATSVIDSSRIGVWEGLGLHLYDEYVRGVSENEWASTAIMDVNAYIDAERRFLDLTRHWREETRFLSAVDKVTEHPAYQKIIGLGELAIPFIIDDMAHGGCFWSMALTAITGKDPVPKDDAGDCAAIAKHWTNWYQHR
ncbi:hypothetical protein KAX17_01025 [Candidatus Bipolaricaulota bacterium]|nr:hypothetical protein [Candidatus Bipolaricaulota bacterium]